jgi:glucose dehydrogenase
VFDLPRSKEKTYKAWSIYRANPESYCFSDLKLVNINDVHQLKAAWTFLPGIVYSYTV